MFSKEIQLTQAILDKNNDKVIKLVDESDIIEWISKQVSKNQLKNHLLPDKWDWTTAICRASSFSSFHILQNVVDAGANLYNINSNGHTALTWACLHKTDTLQKVKFLFNKDKTLLHATDSRGFSALHDAAQTGQVDVCEYLLQQGADVDVQTNKGTSSMHLAAKCNHADVIKLLYQHGANVELRNKFNNTPLHTAALNGAHDALKTLIELGSDVNAHGQYKRNALHYSAEAGSIECCKELIDRGVPVDIRDKNNITPLYMAALDGHTKCIIFLIDDHGADVNAQRNSGRTPLHVACDQGHLAAVQALILHPNCDVNITDTNGKTPMDLAIATNHQHIVSFFSQLHFAKEITKPIQRELSAVKREMKALKQRDDIAHGIGAMSISDDTKSSGKHNV